MSWKKLLIVICLLLIVGFNFYLYRNEFKVLVDPNDNIFQYALVDEARNIWKNIFAGRLSPRQTWLAPFYLLDSWQERWAEGFALSNYYTHLPQALIGLFGGFKLFVIIRTLMLILLPLMFFWGGAILRLPSAFNLILALFSQAIFTDGLYGIDASSYIWRGWGLSAQLMAVFFLPVAFAYAIDYFENKRNLGKAIFFNFLVASSHFGIFSLMLLGYPLYWIVSVIPDLIRNLFNNSLDSRFRGNDIIKILKRVQDDERKKIFRRITIFILLTFFFLSYFIIPFFLQSQYRNFSVWDPIWKFDSWGMRQIAVWFLNGELFDFGRFPFITLCVLFGFFLALGYLYGVPSTPPIKSGSLRINSDTKNRRLLSYLSLIFLMYFVLFFGRTTLGGLVDLIPGFSEFHQHRIVVMMQFTGIFLGAWFLYQVVTVILNLFQDLLSKNQMLKSIRQAQDPESIEGQVQHDRVMNLVFIIVFVLIGILLIPNLEKPLINYAKDNAVWIERSNKAYLNDLSSYGKIKAKLNTLPYARLYVGRPGNWGKQFMVGEVPLYMVLSQDGFPVIGFLPESWSPNSDPEQFFDENKIEFYNLYNVGYSILPDNIKAPDFAKPIFKNGKYNLYEIKTNGWFGIGESNIAIKSKKTNLLNMTRLWFDSKLFEAGDYPMIDLNQDAPDGKRWYIKMSDKNNFINLNDGIERNIWQANPFINPISSGSLSKQTILIENQENTVNGYKGKVKVNGDCQNCILVLKQSFHPNWEVKVNGEKVKTFPVFPFYIGIPVKKAGSYEVSAEYKPNGLKVFLVLIELLAGSYFLGKYLVSFKKKKFG